MRSAAKKGSAIPHAKKGPAVPNRTVRTDKTPVKQTDSDQARVSRLKPPVRGKSTPKLTTPSSAAKSRTPLCERNPSAGAERPATDAQDGKRPATPTEKAQRQEFPVSTLERQAVSPFKPTKALRRTPPTSPGSSPTRADDENARHDELSSPHAARALELPTDDATGKSQYTDEASVPDAEPLAVDDANSIRIPDRPAEPTVQAGAHSRIPRVSTGASSDAAAASGSTRVPPSCHPSNDDASTGAGVALDEAGSCDAPSGAPVPCTPEPSAGEFRTRPSTAPVRRNVPATPSAGEAPLVTPRRDVALRANNRRAGQRRSMACSAATESATGDENDNGSLREELRRVKDELRTMQAERAKLDLKIAAVEQTFLHAREKEHVERLANEKALRAERERTAALESELESALARVGQQDTEGAVDEGLKQQVEVLQQEIASLRETAAPAVGNEELVSARAEAARLDKALQHAKNETATLTRRAEELAEAREELAAETERLQRDRDRLERELAAAREEKSTADEEIETLHKEHASVTDRLFTEIAEMEHERNSKDDALDRLREQVTNLERERDAARGSADNEAAERLRAIECNLQGARDELAAAVLERDGLITEATALRERVAELTTSAETASQHSTRLAGETAALSAVADTLHARVKELTAEVERLQTRLDDEQRDSDALRHDFDATEQNLQREIAALQTRVTYLQEQQAAQPDADDLRAQIARLTQEAAASQSAADAFKIQVAQLEKTLSEREASFKSEAARLEAVARAHEVASDDSVERVAGLERECQEHAARVLSLEQQSRESTERVLRLEEEMDLASTRSRTLELEKTNLVADVSAMQKMLRDAESVIQARDAAIARLAEEGKAQAACASSAAEELALVQKEHQSLVQRVAASEKQHAAAAEDKQTTLKQSAAAETLARELRAVCIEQRECLDAATAEADQCRAELVRAQMEADALHAKLATLSSTVDTSSQRVHSLEAQVASLAADIAAGKARENDLAQRLAVAERELSHERARASDEMERIRHENSQSGRRLAEEAKARKDESEATLAAERRDLSKQREDVLTECAMWRAAAESARAAVERRRLALDESERERHAARLRADELAVEASTLRRELTAAQASERRAQRTVDLLRAEKLLQESRARGAEEREKALIRSPQKSSAADPERDALRQELDELRGLMRSDAAKAGEAIRLEVEVQSLKKQIQALTASALEKEAQREREVGALRQESEVVRTRAEALAQSKLEEKRRYEEEISALRTQCKEAQARVSEADEAEILGEMARVKSAFERRLAESREEQRRLEDELSVLRGELMQHREPVAVAGVATEEHAAMMHERDELQQRLKVCAQESGRKLAKYGKVNGALKTEMKRLLAEIHRLKEKNKRLVATAPKSSQSSAESSDNEVDSTLSGDAMPTQVADTSFGEAMPAPADEAPQPASNDKPARRRSFNPVVLAGGRVNRRQSSGRRVVITPAVTTRMVIMPGARQQAASNMELRSPAASSRGSEQAGVDDVVKASHKLDLASPRSSPRKADASAVPSPIRQRLGFFPTKESSKA